MINPMRVEWDVPDTERRRVAGRAMDDDIRRIQLRDNHDPGLEMELAACRSGAERERVLLRRYPDISATVTRFGTLLSVRYVPEQWGVRSRMGGFDSQITLTDSVKLSEAKWVALVATEKGTVEMDPTTLRVMWPCAPGDPIGGVVTASELRRRGETADESWIGKRSAGAVDGGAS